MRNHLRRQSRIHREADEQAHSGKNRGERIGGSGVHVLQYTTPQTSKHYARGRKMRESAPFASMRRIMRKKNIVVIGGGTGTFTVLSGLKKYPVNLTAIVAMSDSGGSTGILRDELGVLPPGDVMRCLVALSSSGKLMRELMDYRFDSGNLKGHKFGNLLLSGLEKITGSFDKAVVTA